MAPLATTADLEAYTGLIFEQARSDMALEQVTGAVRSYCGWHIAVSQTDTVTVDGSGARILSLPTLYLTALTSVTEDGEVVDLADVEWSASGFIKRTWNWTTKLRGAVAVITHGYPVVPFEIKDIVLNAAARGLVGTPGVVRDQEQIGDYSRNVTYSQSASNQASGSALLDHEKSMLDKYAIPNPA